MERPVYELLREGATHIDLQARGGFPLATDSAGRLFGCALGAIVIAAGGDPAQVRTNPAYRAASLALYRQLLVSTADATQPCPGRGRWFRERRGCARVTRVGNQIAHLNDRHGWSFDRIANWLRSEHADWLVPVGNADRDPLDASAVTAAVEDLIQAGKARTREI